MTRPATTMPHIIQNTPTGLAHDILDYLKDGTTATASDIAEALGVRSMKRVYDALVRQAARANPTVHIVGRVMVPAGANKSIEREAPVWASTGATVAVASEYEPGDEGLSTVQRAIKRRLALHLVWCPGATT